MQISNRLHQNYLGSVTSPQMSSAHSFFLFFFLRSLADSDKQTGLQVSYLEPPYGSSKPAISIVQSLKK